jgi:hypothetical protein
MPRPPIQTRPATRKSPSPTAPRTRTAAATTPT